VVEPSLDGSSATARYLAASNSDHVEVGFINGVQTPYLETKGGWSVDCVEYKVRIDCGAKVVDHGGLCKSIGTG